MIPNNDTTIYLHHLVNGEIFFLPFNENIDHTPTSSQPKPDVDTHDISSKVNQVIMNYWV